MPLRVLTWQYGYLSKCGWQTRMLLKSLFQAPKFDGWSRFRAFRPQYFIPSIIFSIFIQVTATYGSQFATIDEAGALSEISPSGIVAVYIC